MGYKDDKDNVDVIKNYTGLNLIGKKNPLQSQNGYFDVQYAVYLSGINKFSEITRKFLYMWVDINL